MKRRRVLLLVAILTLTLVAAWRVAVWKSDRAEHLGRQTLTTGTAAAARADLLESHPAVRDWAADASPQIAHWERVDELPQQVAVFETVFWEPRDTTSLRAALSGSAEVKGKTVLEIGTGSGLLALCCLKAEARRVVATDVNPTALANARYNAANMGFADRLELRRVPLDKPDAFSVVGDSEKFDVVISNPPWEEGTPDIIDNYAYFDPGFRLLRSLLTGLGDHLEPGGKALLAYGSREAIKTILRLAPQLSLEVKVLDQRNPHDLPDVFLPGMLLEVTTKSG